MDKNQFSNKQIKVGGTTGVKIVSTKHKDDDYNVRSLSNKKASETGHVVIAELFPKDERLPRFEFRIGHDDGNKVDVDILFGDKNCNHLWKEKGYEGHHTKLTDDEKREYSVSIEIPGRKIFKGIVRVGLLTELNLHDKVTIGESVDVKII